MATWPHGSGRGAWGCGGSGTIQGKQFSPCPTSSALAALHLLTPADRIVTLKWKHFVWKMTRGNNLTPNCFSVPFVKLEAQNLAHR